MLDEFIILINKDDKIIGEVERNKAHSQGLWHRSATVFIFNKKNELLIQKRALNMDWPNLWDSSCSGHVRVNENYEQTAQRELEEELGIECELRSIGKIIEENVSPLGVNNKEYVKIFVCQSDGPFKIQKSELAKIKFMSLKRIQKKIAKHPEKFTPGFIQEFDFYINKLEN